ncbi:MAG TPA: DUF4234 domain-containing protein [Polyangiaceae bacterium]|nr:DUF4234 domain-containing protein [Polyangiaceae bacterium]
MTHREPWLPAVLTMVTCGVYYFYWQYVTTEELRDATGRDDINPLTDLLLTILCCGMWGIYVQYRNAQAVHGMFEARGAVHDDKSSFILILHALSLVNGMTGLFAMMMLQEEFNKAAQLSAGQGAFRQNAFGQNPPRAF